MISWLQTDERRYFEMLGVLPPELSVAGGFLVGEPHDHDPETGRPRFDAYRLRDGVFEVSERPITKKEFLTEMRG